MKTSITLTKEQAKEIKAFLNSIYKAYKEDFYKFDIKNCKREYSRDPLFNSITAGAFGWFLNSNIPFPCVYEAINNITNEILKREDY